ncbi:transcription factor EGL1 [Humulus lupulus]|uniref:transcription factor EGL1 n=1 Tax=Humulus lupulus TaxID=3486 RepID=UPI002B417058|nr:transcription factor EGL1 [Humulus lupulus]
MANWSKKHEEVPQKLSKQLAVTVKSIQWSYAIFWSFSTREQGVLEWSAGYYNGDIKTRKTVHLMELKADKIGSQRSEQLRELYMSLSEFETDQQAKMTSSAAALSPDDLTDAEWYYLVCMSFVFKPGQSLPGRALEKGQPIWLCNAQYADNNVFSRSLLAKSASIQTVVCFPHMEGVIEFGVTDLVAEDHNLLQHIKASLLDLSKPACSEKSSRRCQRTDDGGGGGNDKDPMYAKVEHEILHSFDLDNQFSSSEDDNRSDQRDPNELSGNHDHQPKGLNGEASQVQSLHFMDDDFSNCVQGTMNSGDYISGAFVKQEMALPSSPRHENRKHSHLKETQKYNHTKLRGLDDMGAAEDLHYKRIVSDILQGPSKVIEHLCFGNYDRKSSFAAWKRGHDNDYRPMLRQEMLKKILFTVPFMFNDSSINSNEDLKDWLEIPKKVSIRHVEYGCAETDKEEILNYTIKYLNELDARVEELEAKARKKYQEMLEQTSDNYDNNKIDNERNTWLNKRKANQIDETEPDPKMVGHKDKDEPLNLTVSVREQEVSVFMKCPYKESIFLNIIGAIDHLHLDAYSVQSSTLDGVFSLTLKSKSRGAAIAPVWMIKEALWQASNKSWQSRQN